MTLLPELCCKVCGRPRQVKLRIGWLARGQQMTPKAKEYELCEDAGCSSAALRREADRLDGVEVMA